MKMKIHFLTLLLLLFMIQSNAQRLKGLVLNESNEPVSFAQIGVSGTLLKVQTNSQGEFIIERFPSGKRVIQIYSFLYAPFSDTLNVNQDDSIRFIIKWQEHRMEEVLVQSTRAGLNSGIAYEEMTKDQIVSQNLGQDIPILLQQMTSVVSTSDAGNGIGYTGLRIRGSDPTRINITINGIPQNDAESQGIYWVDMPDLASSVENLQVQRGAGTSTNGASAFGGTINILTQKLNINPYANISLSGGSFQTTKGTVSLGSGLIKNRWALDARASYIRSDGFVDRAKSMLSSYYGQAAYYGNKTLIKYILFGGNERTYQSWYGVFEGKLKNDAAMIDTLVNHYFVNPSQISNLKNANPRTYNYYTHPNQTDNYDQKNHQLHFSHSFNSKWSAQLSLHYTKGKGYYEEYRENDYFSNYGLPNILIYQNDTLLVDSIESTNLLRRKWLDNDFYGGIYSFEYNNNKNMKVILGGAANEYSGNHFGRIIWSEFASTSNPLSNYYLYNTLKRDFNIYLKASYFLFNRINLFGDIQLRNVSYSFRGNNDRFINLDTVPFMQNLFFNPKAGLNFKINNNIEMYASLAIAHKEPSGDDFTLSTGVIPPKPEHMQDFELGVRHSFKQVAYNINLYYMNYEDQLVNTGQLNSVGQNIRINAKSSYRAGVEMEAKVNPLKWLSFSGNATFSENRIREIKIYTDDWDTGIQKDTIYRNTYISFSPALIASLTASLNIFKGFSFDWINKYVSRQYLDNTSNLSRSIDPYWTSDWRFNYTIKLKSLKEIRWSLMVNNLFNQQYSSNGWSYSYYYYGKRNHVNAYYPQAGINILGGITINL